MRTSDGGFTRTDEMAVLAREYLGSCVPDITEPATLEDLDKEIHHLEQELRAVSHHFTQRAEAVYALHDGIQRRVEELRRLKQQEGYA